MSQPADPAHPHGSHPDGQHPHGHSADSAGVPWEGRSFESNAHAGDDGSADAALAAALTARTDSGRDHVGIIDALRTARVLIPLVAEKGEEGIGAHGLVVDKTQELSIVTVAAPDGRRVQPIFSDVTAMSRWDPAARPVPADGRRAALAAASDDTDLIVIDPGSDTEYVVRRPAVWAIAQGHAWEPSWLSPEVSTALHASIGTELAVLDVAVAPGDPTGRLRGAELVVRLELMPGLDQAELDAVLQRLARRWAADDRIAVLADSLAVTLVRGETL